jgi:cobalt-zinc-cadmium efflux system membrane fusion protein
MKLLIPCLLSGLVLAAGCHRQSVVEEAASDVKVAADRVTIQPQSPKLSSLSVESAEASKGSAVRLNGRLAWDDTVTVRIYTPFAGRVMQILAEPGQLVKKGDPLATVASADYGQAQSEARKAAGDFALAERTLRRVRELLEHGAVPQKDVEAAEADYQRTQSEIQRASSRLAFYNGNTNSVDQVYTLRSPLDGVVVEKNLNPGQEIRPDQMLAGTDRQAAPLFTVTDPSRLWILLDANEADLSSLRVGQSFELRSRTVATRTFGGKIELISDFLDPASRTVKVRGSVDNASRQLKAEMFVTAEILPDGSVAGADVSARAVFLKGERQFVFVEEGTGIFARREVKAGPEHNGKVLVLEGLKPGQRVVTDGSLLLEQLLQTPEGG